MNESTGGCTGLRELAVTLSPLLQAHRVVFSEIQRMGRVPRGRDCLSRIVSCCFIPTCTEWKDEVTADIMSMLLPRRDNTTRSEMGFNPIESESIHSRCQLRDCSGHSTSPNGFGITSGSLVYNMLIPVRMDV